MNNIPAAVVTREVQQSFIVQLLLRLVDNGGLGVAGLAVHQLYLHTRQPRIKSQLMKSEDKLSIYP